MFIVKRQCPQEGCGRLNAEVIDIDCCGMHVKCVNCGHHFWGNASKRLENKWQMYLDGDDIVETASQMVE